MALRRQKQGELLTGDLVIQSAERVVDGLQRLHGIYGNSAVRVLMSGHLQHDPVRGLSEGLIVRNCFPAGRGACRHIQLFLRHSGPERLYEGSQGVAIFSGRGDVQINAVIAAVGQCFGNCRGCGGGALQNAGLTGNTQQDRLAGGGCCFHDLFLRIADTQSQPGVLTAGQRSCHEYDGLISGKVLRFLAGAEKDHGLVCGLSRVQLVIQAAEHDSSLFPGGVPIRHEQIIPHTADQTQFVGHSDMPLVGGHVPEGKRIIFREAGDGPVAQGPDQHDCQFLPGDGIAGTEIAGLTGDCPMLIAGPEGRLIPGALRHIRKDPVVGLTALPAEKTAECHGEARPGHGLAHAEGIGGLALKPSLSRAAVDGGCRPVVGRHILKGSRPGGNGKRPAQHRAQAQAGGQLFQNRSFHLSASLWKGYPFLDFIRRFWEKLPPIVADSGLFVKSEEKTGRNSA